MEMSEIELKCGYVCPVIADACCSGKEGCQYVKEG